MQVTLRVALVIYALILFIVVTHLLKKEKLPEKYTILWYIFSLVILLIGIVPQFLEIISKSFGFEVLSNFVIGVLITLLTIMCLALSIMIAKQKKNADRTAFFFCRFLSGKPPAGRFFRQALSGRSGEDFCPLRRSGNFPGLSGSPFSSPRGKGDLP